MLGQKSFGTFFAPIEPHYNRPDVTEVVVNEIGRIGIETRMGWEWIDTPELDYPALRALCDLMAGFTKQDVSEERPVVSSVLPDGARVQCVIPPAVPANTVSITIRKASAVTMALADMGRSGLFERTASHKVGLTDSDGELLDLYRAEKWETFLHRAVEERKNILISGATGSGKTKACGHLGDSLFRVDRIQGWRRGCHLGSTRIERRAVGTGSTSAAR